MNDRERLINDIEKYGLMSSGKTALLKYLRGEPIHRAAAVKANCCECMGCYADGRVDCEMPDCPLYPYMPYRGKNDEVTEEIMVEEIEEETIEV